jgi:hypothetical protein
MPTLGNMVIHQAKDLGSGEMGPSPGPIYLPRMSACVPTEPRVLIGTGPRFSKSRDSGLEGVGPGAYDLPPAPHGPEYTVRGRTKFGSEFFNSKGGNPGPGTHTRLETAQTRRKNAPAYTLRGRAPQLTTGVPVPAPGHTQKLRPATDPVFDARKPNIPGMKFGSGGRPREGVATSGDVGPGEYDISNTRLIAGYPNPPRFSMAFRHPARKPEGVNAEFRMLGAGLGKQVKSASKTAPTFSMGVRCKFAGYTKSFD